MIEFHSSIIISRTPEDVFAFLTNPENFGKWRLDLAKYDILTPGTFTIGTRWIEHGIPLGNKEIIADVEIIEFEPDKQFTIKTVSDNVPFVTTYSVEPADEGTRLNFTLQGDLPILLKLLEPLIKRRVVTMTDANFKNIKRVMESDK